MLLVEFLTNGASLLFAHSTLLTNAAATTFAPAGLVCVWSFGKYELTVFRPSAWKRSATYSPWST